MQLEQVVRDLAPRVLRYARGVTADVASAEEVAQDALAALVGRWRRHGPPDSPDAFAFAVARRRAGRARWRRRLLAPLDVLGLDGGGGGPEPAEAGPERLSLSRDRLRATLAALQRLGRRDREVLLLTAVGELGTEEGARVLGISRSAFKMRLSRARARLLKELTALDTPIAHDPLGGDDDVAARARSTTA